MGTALRECHMESKGKKVLTFELVTLTTEISTVSAGQIGPNRVQTWPLILAFSSTWLTPSVRSR